MDMTLWTLLALVLFLGLIIFLKVPSWIATKLDSRSKQIREELESAQRLREEAQSLLDDCRRKSEEAKKQATEIVESAHREALALSEQAKQKMQDYVERRQQLAEQKIARAESEAIEKVKTRVVDIAVEAAAQVLRDQTDEGTKTTLFDSSLQEVKNRFH